MLVTLDSRGAAVARIELSSPRYCDIDNRSGYLGHLVMDPRPRGKGCPVQLVGSGHARRRGRIEAGRRNQGRGRTSRLTTANRSMRLWRRRSPADRAISVVRDGKELTLSAKLRAASLEVIKPEGDDPLSMLLTLQQFDDAKLCDEEKKEQRSGGRGQGTGKRERTKRKKNRG